MVQIAGRPTHPKPRIGTCKSLLTWAAEREVMAGLLVGAAILLAASQMYARWSQPLTASLSAPGECVYTVMGDVVWCEHQVSLEGGE